MCLCLCVCVFVCVCVCSKGTDFRSRTSARTFFPQLPWRGYLCFKLLCISFVIVLTESEGVIYEYQDWFLQGVGIYKCLRVSGRVFQGWLGYFSYKTNYYGILLCDLTCGWELSWSINVYILC